jgi:vancomycin resistance protein VanW
MAGPTLVHDSRSQLWLRQAKVLAHQGLRLLDHARHPHDFPRPVLAQGGFPHVHARRDLPLLRADPNAQPEFEEGKRHNLQLAAPAFDGLLLGPLRPLSFWRTLGRVTEARGFRHGMELRGGCIVPALGGGLCLLSNALFEVAVRLGWRIDERHGHTLEAVPPPAHLPWGLDATVFWPYVDLRVTPPAEVRLHVAVVADRLVLEVRGREPLAVQVDLQAVDDTTTVEGPGHDGVQERVRRNCLVRKVTQGRQVREDVVAVNRKRLLHDHEQTRNCLTCGELACHARVTLPMRTQR